MIFLAIFSFANGNPELLIEPFNSASVQCGVGALGEYPYLLQGQGADYCTDKCPLTTEPSPSCILLPGQQVACGSVTPLVNTTLVVRICVEEGSGVLDTVSLFEGYAADLTGSWPLVLVTAGWSLVLSLVMVLLLKCCGGCIIITLLILYELALVGLGLALYYSKRKTQGLQAFAILAWTLACLSFLLFICFRKKIKITTKILSMAADFITEQCCIVLVPLSTFLLHLGVVCLWVAMVIFAFSTGSAMATCAGPLDCVFWNEQLRDTLTFMFIMLFWNFELVSCVGQFVISSTVAYWFFGHLPAQHTQHPMLRSVGRVCLHLGSLAFAALCLLLLMLLNLFLELFRWAFKNRTGGRGDCCERCCCGCVAGCIACFERFLRFMDQSSILMMGIAGEGFWRSGHMAFHLFERSKGLFVLTTGSCHAIMVLGRILIASVSALCSYLLLTRTSFFAEQVYGPFFPTLIFWVVGYVIAAGFLDIFGVCAEAILMLFCLEHDALRESRACPKELQEFFKDYLID